MHPQGTRLQRPFLDLHRHARVAPGGQAEPLQKELFGAARELGRAFGPAAPYERIASGERQQRERPLGREAFERNAAGSGLGAHPGDQRILRVALLARLRKRPFGV